MLTDTHCHLTAEPLWQQQANIMATAQACGVSGVVVPATQVADWQAVLSLRGNKWVRAVALGVHPWFAETYHDDLLEELAHYFTQYPDLWLGEVGLDKFIDIAFDKQIFILEQQLKLANTFHRPVILHNVRSGAALLASLKKVGNYGIVHGFSGSLEEANHLIKLGFKIGIGSLLLNDKAKKVHQAAAHLPLSAILLETDSPYMLKNQINTPANTRLIAEKVAMMRGLSLTDLAAQLEENWQTLFQAA